MLPSAYGQTKTELGLYLSIKMSSILISPEILIQSCGCLLFNWEYILAVNGPELVKLGLINSPLQSSPLFL